MYTVSGVLMDEACAQKGQFIDMENGDEKYRFDCSRWQKPSTFNSVGFLAYYICKLGRRSRLQKRPSAMDDVSSSYLIAVLRILELKGKFVLSDRP